MPAAPPPAPGASRKPRKSPSRKPKPRKNDWPMRTAPDVSTVAHAARLSKRFPPEQLGLSKTCTHVDWGDGADARADPDADADASLAPPRERMVRLSAKRGALTSLGALARAAHLNGWRLVVGGADEAAEIFWCCRVSDLDALLRELRAKHTLVRERTRALSFKTTVWVNGERVPSTVVAPPRRPTPREADIGADPEDRRPSPAPEDFDGDLAKMRAAARASAARAGLGTVPSRVGILPSRVGTPVPVEEASSSGRLPCRLRLRVAKFPGMHDVCGKVRFSRLMNRAASLYPSAFAFWPRALILPDDWLKVGDAFADAAAAGESPWHIVKPDKGSQGAGIFLVDAPLDLELRIRRTCKEALYSASMGGGLFGGGIGAGATTAKDIGAQSWRGASAWRRSGGIRGGVGDGSGIRGGAPGGVDPRDASRDPQTPGFVVQRYLERPLLMDGLKFDLRLYVLLLGTEGFPAFLSKEGLARFCTEPYAAPSRANRGAERAFLTNYSLNKKSEGFARSDAVDGGDGSKRSLASVMSELADAGADVDALWRRVETLVASTVAATRHALVDAAEHARVDPEMCFQVLGFDVILDESLRPHLLEVNAGPSLAIDAVVPIDSREAAAAYRGKELGPGSLAAFQSPALRKCASVDVVPAPCYCKDHAGAHVHEMSPVDAHVKSAVLAGALEIVRLAQRGELEDAERGGEPPAAFGGFRRAGSRVGWWIDRDDAERPRRVPTQTFAAEREGGGGGRREEAGDEAEAEVEPEPKIEPETETAEPKFESEAGDLEERAAANEVDETSAVETSAVDETSVVGSNPGGFESGARVARASTVSDEAAGASLDALLERARRAFARVVDTRDASSTSRRECSYSKVRRLVSLCRKPSRDGVASKALSNSELDILLQPWRARRNRADNAFEHFLDLVVALAGKFHKRLEGADAVDAMLDTFDDVHCAVLVAQQ